MLGALRLAVLGAACTVELRHRVTLRSAELFPVDLPRSNPAYEPAGPHHQVTSQRY